MTNVNLKPLNGDGPVLPLSFPVPLPGGPGRKGAGWTGGSYDPETGKASFASDDGLGFSTHDLRGGDGKRGDQGKGWTGGSYDPQTGIATFASDDGLGFSTPEELEAWLENMES